MARTKKTVVSGITREQAEQAFADFAAADAKVQNLTSKMDIEMTRIREKYADQLAELSATKEKNFDIMQAYAIENKEELFSKRKSLESAHGVFGFRTGTPKLKNLKGFTWAAVTNICKELLPQYIRTTDELAKDKLLADRDNPEVAEFFPKIGVQVVQEETFYVEPKKRTMRNLPEEYYEYRPHGRNWVVYRIRRDATGSTGTKVGQFLTKEEARREVYRLNGWKTIK